MQTFNQFSTALLSFITSVSGTGAYALILGILFVCGLGVPIPEDITLISAGILAGQHKISLEGAMAVGFIGVLIGDTLLFTIGKVYGRRVFSWPMFRRIFTPERIAKAELQITTHAKKICFTARFMPGLRAAIYLTAGIMRVPLRTFMMQDGLAALISVPVWIYVGFWFSENISGALALAKNINAIIIGALVVALIFFVISARRKKS